MNLDDLAVDRMPFFDRYPRFLDTSEVERPERRLGRLNGRYEALIRPNRALIAGARVLDLASHDGRWSFAALHAGAERIVGIEHKESLARKSVENMEFYGVHPERYDFIFGDMFEHIDNVGHCDVVFCFGVYYHITEHMLLLSKIASLEPRVFIMDTNISTLEQSVIELKHEAIGGTKLVGQPSKAALDDMFASFGWKADYFDWKSSDLCGPHHLSDYWSGRRVTAVVSGS